jgi:predicted ester cyclase
MRQTRRFVCRLLPAGLLAAWLFSGCASPKENRHVEANIQKYCSVWDEIINRGRLDQFNDANFTPDVLMHVSPNDLVGIAPARDYYANFLKGFSNIQFTIIDCFGQGDKLVKHWNFKGAHTGDFFGIPPTGKTVNIQGTTLVRMAKGKIAEEQDFFDNLEFNTQLGLAPAAAK